MERKIKDKKIVKNNITPSWDEDIVFVWNEDEGKRTARENFPSYAPEEIFMS